MRIGIVMSVLMSLVVTEARADMIDASSIPPHEHCALCHGLNGISRMAKFPKLAGQRLEYLEKQLRDFKAGRRVNDGGPMAGTVDQFEIEQLLKAAKWFSDQPAPPPVESEGDNGAGRILFEDGKPSAGVPACRSCHGVATQTAFAVPRLEAQHARYLQKQLHDFKSEERNSDPGGVMRGIAASLTEDDIDAVAAYLASQPRLGDTRP